MRLKHLGALGIISGTLSVLTTVNFYDQLGLVADKVRDVWANLNLTTEMRSRSGKTFSQM